MPLCVSCEIFQPDKRLMHMFVSANKADLYDLWLTALTKNDSAKARLDWKLKNTSSKQYVCASHFSDSCYNRSTTGNRFLRADAVPLSQRASPIDYDVPTVPPSPSPTPHPATTLKAGLPSSFSLLPPPPSFRLADARIPPCCRCCCKKETSRDEEGPELAAPSPTIHNLPKSDYFIVDKASLVQLLSRCRKCRDGQNSLTFSEDAHALSCKSVCTSCGELFVWSNSPVLKTANDSSKEKLRKVNVDMVVGSTITAVGTSRLNHFLNAVGLNVVSKTSYHRLKSDYLYPAVSQVFSQAQEEVFKRLNERISKGEKLHVAGDGSFDSRGYSAEWCRYFLVDADTGEALIHVLMNKKETGSSGTLEKALNALAAKIGGVHHISTLVTDRHSAAIKMMKDRFPTVRHFFDPGHYFRNLTLNLLKIIKPNYMVTVKAWHRTLKAYDAVVRAEGNGVLASEMFRSSLLCISGIHDFSNLHGIQKKSLHPPASDKILFIAKDSRPYNRLQSVIYTEKNIQDIMNVSWILKTNTVESLNALAWRNAPKNFYFDRKGHELRTKMTMLHWNELKQDEAEGTRNIMGQKPYSNNTLKKPVYRNVKTPAKNVWRRLVKSKAYQIRATAQSTPYAAIKKEQEEMRKKKDHWNFLNTPTVPLRGDRNLDESEDEDDVPLPFDGDRIDALLEETRRLLEEDDEYRRKEEGMEE